MKWFFINISLLARFKRDQYFLTSMDFKKIREKALAETGEKLRNSVSDDLFIMQAVNNIEEIDKTANTLSKRLREWYSYYFPELDVYVADNEAFCKLALEKSKKELLKEFKEQESLGADLKEIDINQMKVLAKTVKELFDMRHSHVQYLEIKMKEMCPNVLHICGASIGAKLISLAGSFKKISVLPASTIQVLGAEKALFRHLKNRKCLPPKYGVLLNHSLVSRQRNSNKGKVARALADKIALCARVDYFKGEFVADTLLKELEDRFK